MYPWCKGPFTARVKLQHERQRERHRHRQRQCFEWVVALRLGVNGTDISQCNPSTSGDDAADVRACYEFTQNT